MESIFLIQGLANRLAEDMAEFGHRQIRQILGYEKTQGERFSPGYPLIEKLKNNSVIFKILKGEELGISLTEACGFSPLSTTSAVICFHPDLATIP